METRGIYLSLSLCEMVFRLIADLTVLILLFFWLPCTFSWIIQNGASMLCITYLCFRFLPTQNWWRKGLVCYCIVVLRDNFLIQYNVESHHGCMWGTELSKQMHWMLVQDQVTMKGDRTMTTKIFLSAEHPMIFHPEGKFPFFFFLNLKLSIDFRKWIIVWQCMI